MPRISGGQLKGRTLTRKVFRGPDDLRPTSSKVREAVFDILRDRITGSSFLDLYAGTGAVGFEALSRGASEVIFVESSPSRARILKSEIDRFGVAGRAFLITGKADMFVRRAASEPRTFDIIFADPPYASSELDEILRLIDENDVLSPNGCLIAEHTAKYTPCDAFRSFKIAKRYRYGDTMLSLYRREP